jgi:hypothetical protein
MRTYKYTNSPQEIKEYFQFLIDEYKYSIIEESITNYGPSYIYINNIGNIRVKLNYDYKDNFYYFEIIKGVNTKYPNDLDNENIRPLFKLVKKYEVDFDVRKLQPDNNQYLEALKLNAEMLKKYGDKILKGQEWF